MFVALMVRKTAVLWRYSFSCVPFMFANAMEIDRANCVASDWIQLITVYPLSIANLFLSFEVILSLILYP